MVRGFHHHTHHRLRAGFTNQNPACIPQSFGHFLYCCLHSLIVLCRFFIRYANADVKYPINYLSTVLEEHRAIFEAFRTRNPEAGQDAAQAHIFRSMLRRK